MRLEEERGWEMSMIEEKRMRNEYDRREEDEKWDYQKREDEEWVRLKRRGYELRLEEERRMVQEKRIRNDYSSREENEKLVW